MLDINKMIEAGIPIFVINRTHRVFGKPHLLMLEFPNPTGGRKSIVKLPPIPHPINLSQRVAPVTAIGACQDFITLVHNGALELVDPEEARRKLADPEIQAAIQHAYDKINKRYNRPSARMADERRRKLNFQVRGGGSRVTDAVAQPESEGLTSSDFLKTFVASRTAAWSAEEATPDHLGNSMEAPGVTPSIVQFCVDLRENPELRRDYLLDLRNMDESTLLDADLAYMLNQLRDFDAITSFIRSIMAKRAGKSAPQPMQQKTATLPDPPKRRSKKSESTATSDDGADQQAPDASSMDEWLNK